MLCAGHGFNVGPANSVRTSLPPASISKGSTRDTELRIAPQLAFSLLA